MFSINFTNAFIAFSQEGLVYQTALALSLRSPFVLVVSVHRPAQSLLLQWNSEAAARITLLHFEAVRGKKTHTSTGSERHHLEQQANCREQLLPCCATVPVASGGLPARDAFRAIFLASYQRILEAAHSSEATATMAWLF